MRCRLGDRATCSALLRYPPATLVERGSPLAENATPPPVLLDEILHPDSVPDASRAGRRLQPAGSVRRAGPGAQTSSLGEGTDLQAGSGGRSGLTGADSPSPQPRRPPRAPGAPPPSRPVLRFKLRGGWRPTPQPIGVQRGGAEARWFPEVGAGRGGTRGGESSGRGWAGWAWLGEPRAPPAGRGTRCPSIRYPKGCQATRISLRAWDPLACVQFLHPCLPVVILTSCSYNPFSFCACKSGGDVAF